MNILYIADIDNFDKKCMHILNIMTDALSINHQVKVYGNMDLKISPGKVECLEFVDGQEAWDVVFVQNSWCLVQYASLISRLRRVPLVFVSCNKDVTGCIPPLDNLYGVLNCGGADLRPWGIPSEMQIFTDVPIIRSNNYFHYEERLSHYEIAYFPTLGGVNNSFLKMLSLSRFSNVSLTIVSDIYPILQPALNLKIRIVPEKKSLSVLKRAHVVLASGYNAVRAMSCGKPCIILGDYGLGGRVGTDNYENLKKHGFSGRAGASYNEFIPVDLLGIEVQKTLQCNNPDEIEWLRQRVTEDFNFKDFRSKLEALLTRISSLTGPLSRKKFMYSLKPFLTSIFRIEEIGDKKYLRSGNDCYSEMDDDLLELLKQCDGKKTIREIVLGNGYEKEDVSVFSDNLKELWKKKLVMFYV